MIDRDATSTAKVAKVLIVDDHPVVREGLSIRLSAQPDLQVCGEAADVTEALRMIDSRQPDIVIVDILLKNGNGLDLIKRIKARTDEMQILVWSMYDESLYAERALRAGATGYVNKREATRSIVDAIRSVREGNIYVSDSVADHLLHQVTGKGNAAPGPPVQRLSDRELEVFQLIGSGMATSEIASQLHLSVKTVETHRQRIKSKLNLQHGAELVRCAVQWVLENG